VTGFNQHQLILPADIIISLIVKMFLSTGTVTV